ncbi:MAG: hypothetical protein GX608_03885 [Lentisphaerae bacterium]|nr:hypothetical protein [Lentisphaerota bacterium]
MGLTVDLRWENNALTGADIASARGGTFLIRHASASASIRLAPGQAARLDGALHSTAEP